jgi:hypothetical protein
VQEVAQAPAGGLRLAFRAQVLHRRLHLLPVGAQGIDDRRDHQPLDVGARGVVRAQLAALARVEGVFQQGPEDRRLDVRPVAGGGDVELVDALGVQRQGGGVLEQGAVEALDGGVQVQGVAALVHDPPELRQGAREGLRRRLLLLEQLGEAVLGQQADVLREHGEQAAHQEGRDLPGVVVVLQALGDVRQPVGDVARDLRRAAGRVEGLRVGPDLLQAPAEVGVAQVLQVDAVGLPVGEVGVVLALAGEVGEHLDHVGNVDHQQERRVAVVDRQRAGVVGGLLAGLAHHRVPGARPALGLSGLGGRLLRREQAGLGAGARGAAALGGLLGLQDEAVALVAVDPPGRAGAVGVLEVDAAFEDVVVLAVVLLRRARPVNT